jgi:Flp pilus assembly protein TadG
MTRARHTLAGTADQGTAAVELAILLPVLLLVVFAIVDFGRMLNSQIIVTEAAREGARWAALGQTSPSPAARATTAAIGLAGPAPTATVTACPVLAVATDRATATVTYQFSFITPFNTLAGMFGPAGANTVQLTGRAVMRCGG